MKVKDLIEELKKYDPEFNVVMSRDGEGNGHLPLSDISLGFYAQADGWWSGEFVGECDIEELKEDVPSAKINTICLWPVG